MWDCEYSVYLQLKDKNKIFIVSQYVYKYFLNILYSLTSKQTSSKFRNILMWHRIITYNIIFTFKIKKIALHIFKKRTLTC